MKRILITGAGGFIGGHLVESALARQHETWAAVRSTTSRKYLADERINFIELDFTDSDKLREALKEHIDQHGKWDYVVHNMGVTKATNYLEFDRVNYGYLRDMVEALQEMDAVPEVFLLMSSLSVMGPGDEVGYKPFESGDVPAPNTRYGTSKLKAETFLATRSAMPYTIFRCTGVYGPREKDYFLMMKSIKRGIDVSVGLKKQLLTFIYVKDLAEAVMDALAKGPLRKAYFISEDKSYTQKEFRTIVCEELGKKRALSLSLPLWLVKAACAVTELYGKATLKPTTLNSDKYRILKQRNWLCDISEAKADFGFNPTHSLRQGIHEAIEWYKQEGWL